PADHRGRFIFPQAPTRPVTINNGIPMPCWFDILAISPQRVMNTQKLDEAVAMARALVAQQMAQASAAERIVLASSSHAGAIVLRAAVDGEQPLAGVMALTT